MNDTFEFLSKLQQRDIKLSAEGEKLFVDAPEGVLTPELRREIVERKQLLLGLLGQTTALPALFPTPDQRHQPFPLTDIQQAYWLGRDIALELGNISAHFYLELEGQGLDLERLNWAWQRLIERHDMLRAIILPDGQQQVLPQVPAYRIEVLGLRGQAEARLRLKLR